MAVSRRRCPNCEFEVADEGICSLCGHEIDEEE
jgi:rRNA maturation endonuclease Nob1